MKKYILELHVEFRTGAQILEDDHAVALWRQTRPPPHPSAPVQPGLAIRPVTGANHEVELDLIGSLLPCFRAPPARGEVRGRPPAAGAVCARS